jgi:hypothetical protein
MAKSKLTPHQQIDELIAKLESTIKEMVVYLRRFVLDTDEWIEEGIKWNSMSFYYFGEMKPFDPKEYKRDILVCNIHRGKILLVFPTGAKVLDNLGGNNYPDGRKIIAIEDLDDLKAKENAIRKIIQEWLTMVE